MIREIQPGDWSAIDRVQRACFPASAIESLEALRSIAEAAPGLCAVAESGEGVIGYLLSHPWFFEDLPVLNRPLEGCPEDADTLFLHDMAVLPSARGGGLASVMVNRALGAAQERNMAHASLLSVQGTVDFWTRFGFVTRPELTVRFRECVFGFYEIDFNFMTASLR